MLWTFRKKREHEACQRRIGDTEFVVLDTELTGLNELKDHVIAIGAIKMRGKTIKLGDIFYRTVSPTKAKFRKESIMIHEITPSELEKCPKIEPILREFLEFSKNSIIVGHCVDIDLTFLKKEFRDSLKISYQPKAVDILPIFKWSVKRGLLRDDREERNSLEDIASFLNIEVKSLHDALADAFTTAQIFQRLLTCLENHGISNLDELMKIGNPYQKSIQYASNRQTYQF